MVHVQRIAGTSHGSAVRPRSAMPKRAARLDHGVGVGVGRIVARLRTGFFLALCDRRDDDA
jgi:hypothetical protein